VSDKPSTPKLRNYLSRREQWRLLLLVISLGLVLILMNEARMPENWQWLLDKPRGGGNRESLTEDVPAANRPNRPADDDNNDDDDEQSEVAVRPDGKAAPQARTVASTDRSEASETASGSYFPGVRPELFDSIRQRARFHAEEQDAWFHLLAVLEQADPAALRRASIGRVSRLQLFEQSKAYRGELVTTVGVVRRAHRLKAPTNDYGITGYDQLWVRPDDSPDWPIVVYCLHLPEGFPTGMNLSERVEITGFSFKQWLYRSAGGLELAPVILARNVQWERDRPSYIPQSLTGMWAWALVVGSAAVLAGLMVGYISWRTRASAKLARTIVRTGRDGPAGIDLENIHEASTHFLEPKETKEEK